MAGNQQGTDENARLEELVLEVLDGLETRGEQVVAEVCAREPALAERLRARLHVLRKAGLIESGAESGIPERLGDFRLLERLGRGGMGVVYLAEQTSLGRRVALKMIRPESLYFGGARARFRREVKAVARLSHPSIVPIFVVGEESGIPYFAMELVDGCSLADVLRELRSRSIGELEAADVGRVVSARAGRAPGQASAAFAEPRPALFTGSYVDCCLRIAHATACALAHAHERGVLHRDVKPSNVMLTPGGRVLLVDFGLAASAGSERVTRTGAQLGSLAYMAPEQIEGRPEKIGPRTDVYGLGVTLYELIALRPPYLDENTTRLCRLIVEARPRPMRERNPSVARDVETVVARAMDVAVERRYGSADPLARDLENLLAHRPIDARRPSVAYRLSRWARRDPAAATAVALGVLVAVGGPIGFGVQQSLARGRVETAKNETEEVNRKLALALEDTRAESARAERNFEKAMEAIALLTSVSRDQLAEVPAATKAREELLESALAFHQALLTERGDDPRLRRENARSKARVGDLLLSLGRPREAAPVIREGLADYEALAREAAAQGASGAEGALETGACRIQLGEALTTFDPGPETRAAFERGLAEVQSFGAADDAGTRLRIVAHTWTARAWKGIAQLERYEGRKDKALDALERARAEFEILTTLAPHEPRHAMAMANMALHIGGYLMEPPAPAGAQAASGFERVVAAYDTAIAALETARKAEPGNLSVAKMLAECHSSLGPALMQLGRPEPARAHLEAGLDLLRDLTRRLPEDSKLREVWYLNTTNLGVLYEGLGQPSKALALFHESVSICEALVREFPQQDMFRGSLAMAELNRAQLCFQMGLLEESLEAGLRCEENLRAHLEKHPQDVVVGANANYAVVFLAGTLLKTGRWQEAMERLRSMPLPATGTDEFYAAGAWENCIDHLVDASSVPEPGRSDSIAACREAALAALERMVEKGCPLVSEFAAKPFDKIRDDPRFEAVAARMRSEPR